MNDRYNYPVGNINPTGIFIVFVAIAFSGFISILLLRYILYETGSLYSNILVVTAVCITRMYLYGTQKSSSTHDKACLLLFILYDRSLLDLFNVCLLGGAGCLLFAVEVFLEHLNQSVSPTKELISISMGLTFLLMEWFSVGRVLVIYTLVPVLILMLGLIQVVIKSVIIYFYPTLASNFGNEWDEVD